MAILPPCPRGDRQLPHRIFQWQQGNSEYPIVILESLQIAQLQTSKHPAHHRTMRRAPRSLRSIIYVSAAPILRIFHATSHPCTCSRDHRGIFQRFWGDSTELRENMANSKSSLSFGEPRYLRQWPCVEVFFPANSCLQATCAVESKSIGYSWGSFVVRTRCFVIIAYLSYRSKRKITDR